MLSKRDRILRVIRDLREAVKYNEAQTGQPYTHGRERIKTLLKEV